MNGESEGATGLVDDYNFEVIEKKGRHRRFLGSGARPRRRGSPRPRLGRRGRLSPKD